MDDIIVPVKDIEYLANQSQSQLDIIIAGMASIVSDTENKAQAMEDQGWFQRMANTLTGKNKLTVQELRQNHEKLNAYSIQALSELYKMNKVNQEIMISLGNKINEIYASQIHLRQTVGKQINELQAGQIQLQQMLGMFANKLNEKIESVDKFNMLQTEIEQGVYDKTTPIVSLFRILSQFESRVVKDERKIAIIERAMKSKNILSDSPKSVKAYLIDILSMPENYAGLVHLAANEVNENYIAQMAVLAIQNYHFMSGMNRSLLNKTKIAEDIMEAFSVEETAEISTDYMYSDLVRIKRYKAESMTEVTPPQVEIIEESPKQVLLDKLQQAENLYILNDITGAYKLFSELAEDGNVHAMYYLGKIYKNGEGGIEKDIEKGKKWYIKATVLAFQHQK